MSERTDQRDAIAAALAAFAARPLAEAARGLFAALGYRSFGRYALFSTTSFWTTVSCLLNIPVPC